MAESGKKIVEYTTLTAPTSNTYLVVSHNANTYKIAVTNLFANLSGNVSFSNSSVLSVNTMIVRRGDTPANSTITVTEGTMWFDDNYLYVAVANNSLKRVTLESF